MAATSTRTLRLLAVLQTHRHWRGEELAGELAVSVRTLRRDVERLRELGYPVTATRGVEGGYQLAAGAVLPPLVLDDDEAVALAVGMLAVTQGSVPGIEETALRALTKVVQVLPPRLRRRVDALRSVTVGGGGDRGPGGGGGGDRGGGGNGGGDRGGGGDESLDPAVLTTLAQACRDSECLGFDYTARAGERSTRSVEPLRLVPLGRRWYLVAYDLTRHAWRSFRVDRICAPRPTSVRFRPRALPGPGDAAAFVRAGIRDVPTPFAVQARVAAPAATVRAGVGRWASVEPVDADTCLLRMTAESLDWPALALGVVGEEFTVVSPPELVDLVQDWGSRFTRSTDPSAGHPPAAAVAPPVRSR